MDPLSSLMVRASLLWLLTGVVIGGAMLTDRVLPGEWVLWLAPSHAHMLFVGWFLQFAVGVAYWLLPRRRTAERPLGYQERVALLGVTALNLGLALRVIAEPVERTGQGTDLTLMLLMASALLQVGAVAIFVRQLWPRVAPRQRVASPRAPVEPGADRGRVNAGGAARQGQ
jgi:hypothetical protein